MSRQNTDQLYIEIDYFTPEEYFVYTAEVEATAQVQASMDCTADRLRVVEASATLVSEFTQTATISHIEGADLFALADAALAVAVQRLRDNNIAADVAFDIATDGRVYRDVSADVDAALSLSAINSRSRASSLETQAAFSFDSSADRFRSSDISLAVTADLSCTISHIEGADIVVTGFASLSVDANAAYVGSSNISVETTSTALVGNKKSSAASSLNVASDIYATKYIGSGRPRNLTASAGTIQSSIKKFGAGASSGSGNNATITNSANVIPNVTDDFILEGWFYPTANENYDLIFFGSKFVRLGMASDGDLLFRWYKNGSTTATTIYNGSTARTLNTWHHWAIVNNSSGTSLYLDGTRLVNYLHTVGDTWTGYNELTTYSISTAATSAKYVDEYNFQVGTRLGVDPSSSSMTVPTAARTNDPATTVFLYHFDTDYKDDIYNINLGAAALSSAFELTASLIGTQNFASLQASLGTLTANVEVVSIASSAMSALTDLTMLGGKLQTLNSNLESSTSITALGGKLKDFEADIASENTFSLSIDIFRGFALLAPMQATITVDSKVSYSAVSAMTTQATISASVFALVTRQSLRGNTNPGPLLSESGNTGDPDVRGAVIGLRSSSNWPTVIGDTNIDSPSYAVSVAWLDYTYSGNPVYLHNSYGTGTIETARPNDWLNSTYTVNSPGDDGWTEDIFYYPSISGLGKITPNSSYINPQFEGREVGLIGPGTSGRSIPFGQYENNPDADNVLISANANEFTWSLWFKYDEDQDVQGKDLWRGRHLMGFWSNFIEYGTTWPNGTYKMFPAMSVQIDMNGRLEFLTKGLSYSQTPGLSDVFDAQGSFRTDIICGDSASGVNLADGEWHHIVASGIGANNAKTIKLKIDGQTQTIYTNTDNFTSFPYTRTTDFWLLPSANVVKNNAEAYNESWSASEKQAWWTRNLARDPIIISDAFWDDKYVDLDNATVLSKFYIDETSLPKLDYATGQQPMIYHRGSRSMSNLGWLGDFEAGITYWQSRSSVTEDNAYIAYWNLQSVKEFDFPPQLAVNTSLATAVTKITGGSSALESVSSLTINAGILRSAEQDISVQATLTAQGYPVKDSNSSLELACSLTATAQRSRSTDIQLDLAVQVQAQARKITQNSIYLDVAADQTATVLRIRSAAAEFTAFYSELAAVAKNATGTVLLESQFSITADAVKNGDLPATLASEFTQTVDILRVVGFSADLSSSTAMDADGYRIQAVGSDMSAELNLTATTTNSKITRVSSNPSTTSSLSAQAERFRDVISLEAGTFSLGCDNQVLRLASASLSNTFTILASPQFIIRITAEFTAFNSILTVGDVLNFDPYLTLVIKAENRVITLESETRALHVNPESRELLIEGYE